MKSATRVTWTPQVYDRLSSYYDRLSRWLFPVADQSRKRAVAGLNRGSILDVGCGTGTLLGIAHENGLQCHGIDTSQGMLNQVRSKAPTADLVKASYYDLPYTNEAFDCVVETNAVSGADIDSTKVLLEMLRVCKVGGEIRLVDWAMPPRTTWQNRLIIMLGSLSGDVPRDYPGMFRELGYAPEIKVLGHQGLYQYIRVKKDH